MGGVAQRAKRQGQRVRTASGSDRAKRFRRLRSDLGKKIWAVIRNGKGVTGNLTHAAALKLAAKTGGYVTTQEAILRCD